MVCFKASFYEFLLKENNIFEMRCLLSFNRDVKTYQLPVFVNKTFYPTNLICLKETEMIFKIVALFRNLGLNVSLGLEQL